MVRITAPSAARREPECFVNGICNSLKRGNIIEAIANCDETAGPVAQVVKAAVVNHDRSREEIRDAVQDVARTEVAHLERRLVVARKHLLRSGSLRGSAHCL